MADLNTWWSNRPDEKFWLEVTGRDDLGGNLKAPQTNEQGRPFWSYSLVRELQPGDIVFHYDRRVQQVVGRSIAAGGWWEDQIVWAARGTYARDAGIEPHRRLGWYAGIENFAAIDPPLTLDEIRLRTELLAENLEELRQETGGGALYYPFEIGRSRPVRTMQGYLFKLPAFFTAAFPRLLPTELHPDEDLAEIGDPTTAIGTEYRPAAELTAVGVRDPFSIDPALVERGLRGHNQAQNALADHLLEKGIQPRSPRSTDPNFDLAWSENGIVWVAEVKSLTAKNEEKQLRLGLGQVLRYRHQLAGRNAGEVRGVLLAEREPTDPGWNQLCRTLGVELVWPGTLDKLDSGV